MPSEKRPRIPVLRNDRLLGVTSCAEVALAPVTAESMERPGRATGVDVAAEAVRRTERALLGDAELTGRHIDHAEAVLRLYAALRDERPPIKRSMSALGIDYDLARHAVWIRETVQKYRYDHAAVATMGPSLVLLVREAARRFKREGRRGQLPALIADLAGGISRSAAREKYLPSMRHEPTAVMRMLTLLRHGRLERARRAFAQYGKDEKAELRRITRDLAMLCRIGNIEIASSVLARPEANALPSP